MPTRFRVALRRSLALSALVTAGALAYSPRGDAAAVRYVSGSFAVVLDDKIAGYVTEAGGGSPVGTVVMDSTGAATR